MAWNQISIDPASRLNRKKYILGRDIKEGTRVKTWFMPEGTLACGIEEYRGPLAYLWPCGARIITFNAKTRSGMIPMTVENDDRFELVK